MNPHRARSRCSATARQRTACRATGSRRHSIGKKPIAFAAIRAHDFAAAHNRRVFHLALRSSQRRCTTTRE